MAQVPPIDDAYINEIIKSNGPYNPLLIKTQGTKMRELIKLLRDRMEQGDLGVVRTTGDQSISGTKTFTLLKAEGISVNNLANPALNTVISPVNGVQTKLLNLNADSFAVQLAASGLSALRTQTLQDKSGVIALTSDIQGDRFNPIAGTGISLNGTYPNITINTTGIDSTPDATTLIRGKVRLSGDLAGNADAPTVPGLALKIDNSQRGIPGGIPTLDSGGKVLTSQLPDSISGALTYQGVWNAATNTPTLTNPPASSTKGYYYVANTAGTQFGITVAVGDWIVSNGIAWEKVDNSDAVTTVFGRLGNILANEEDYSAFYPLLSGNYADPSWITSLAYSKITGANLQAVTNGAFNNITDNAIHITGANQFDITKDGLVLAGGVTQSVLGQISSGTLTQLVFQKEDVSNPGSTFNSRLAILDATHNDEATTLGQVNSLISSIPSMTLQSVTAAGRTTTNGISIENIDEETGFTMEIRHFEDATIRGIWFNSNITGENANIEFNSASTSLMRPRTFTSPISGSDLTNKTYVDGLVSGFELLSNKQNSLIADATNTKYPTVTAVNSGLATKNPLIAHLQFNDTDKTVWNAGKGDVVGNTSFGDQALRANRTGFNNSAFGRDALTSNTTGNQNTAIGNRTLIYSNGGDNTAVGFDAMFSNTSGFSNTGIGRSSLNANTTGYQNTGVGQDASQRNTTGLKNTSIGAQSLYYNNGGGQNVGVGYQAGSATGDEGGTGYNNNLANNSTYIGVQTQSKVSGSTNETVIGYFTTGNGSNTVTIGNSAITNNYFNGNINATGDLEATTNGKGFILKSPNGTRWRITVSDAGVLTTSIP